MPSPYNSAFNLHNGVLNKLDIYFFYSFLLEYLLKKYKCVQPLYVLKSVTAKPKSIIRASNFPEPNNFLKEILSPLISD